MRIIVAVLLAAMALAVAAAAPPTVVRPLPGFVCMKLSLTEAQALDPRGSGIYIRLQPDDNAPVGRLAPSVVFARTPAHVEHGYLEVVQITGKPGWIRQSQVRPMAPTERCVPSVMSNGYIGAG